MSELYTGYAVLGATVLALALAGEWIKRYLWVSSALLAMLVGIISGPLVTGLMQPANWGNQTKILEELAYITLAISLMGVAFRLPDSWVQHKWRPLALILIVGMSLMWLLASLCGWLILDLPVLQALLLGALITPTDPVVADSIVTGALAENNLKEDTRHLISAEAGANDGLAYILVMLPVLLLESPPAEALTYWVMVTILGKVLCPILAGALIGYLTAKAMTYLYGSGHSHQDSILAVTLALALVLLGIVHLLHGDGILAVFAAGLTLNWMIRADAGHKEAQHERVQQTIKQFLEVPVFILFGMVLPVTKWLEMGYMLLVFALLILFVRRLPVIIMMGSLFSLRSWRDKLFVGWFGPVGVAAMVYATWADVKEGYESLWTIASLVIFVSLVCHGITATPFIRLYGRHDK